MTVVVERRYASGDEATAIARALEADRPSYLATAVRGRLLRLTVESDSASSVRATLDDALAGLTVAERTLIVARPPARRPARVRPRSDPGRARGRESQRRRHAGRGRATAAPG